MRKVSERANKKRITKRNPQAAGAPKKPAGLHINKRITIGFTAGEMEYLISTGIRPSDYIKSLIAADIKRKLK